MSSDTTTQRPAKRFLFPQWANYLLPGLLLAAIGLLTYVPLLLGLFLSPLTTDVGYRPLQPVAFSHEVHAGQLEMDCRYCHTTVESASYAAIPDTKICMNCHASITAETEKMQLVSESYSTGKPISWLKVHDQPDFVFFNHAAHVNHGVGCVTCHGRVDQMEVVYQDKPLSMAWCLECHRDPTPYLRPRSQITNMTWDPGQLGKTQLQLGQQLMQEYEIPSATFLTNCTACHR